MIISIEGPDYCGKTTVINKLKEYLIEINQIDKFMFSREPDNKAIRNILLNQELTDLERIYLFTADRAMLYNHYKQQDKIIISDRSILTTYAYQARNKELLNIIETISKPIFNKEDHIFIVLLPDKEIIKNRAKQRDEKNVLDEFMLSNIDSIYDAYYSFNNIASKTFYITSDSQVNEIIEILKKESIIK